MKLGRGLRSWLLPGICRMFEGGLCFEMGRKGDFARRFERNTGHMKMGNGSEATCFFAWMWRKYIGVEWVSGTVFYSVGVWVLGSLLDGGVGVHGVLYPP